MHGIKDPEVKEMSDEAASEEEAEIKEDAKVRHLLCSRSAAACAAIAYVRACQVPQ